MDCETDPQLHNNHEKSHEGFKYAVYYCLCKKKKMLHQQQVNLSHHYIF